MVVTYSKETASKKKAIITQSPIGFEKFKTLKSKTKQMIARKRKDHTSNIKDSLSENPKRFWSL